MWMPLTESKAKVLLGTRGVLRETLRECKYNTHTFLMPTLCFKMHTLHTGTYKITLGYL